MTSPLNALDTHYTEVVTIIKTKYQHFDSVRNNANKCEKKLMKGTVSMNAKIETRFQHQSNAINKLLHS